MSDDPASESAYDVALGQVHRHHAEYVRWSTLPLSTHTPMVLDALVALGAFEQAAPAYLEAWWPHLSPARPEGPPVPLEEGLGDIDALPGLVAYWRGRLAAQSWREVLAEGLTQLGPGAMGAALHGWLRVAHAVRALGRAETPQRLEELAWGLGYWAARYQELPGIPGGSPETGTTAAQVLASLPRVEPADEGLIYLRMRALRGHAGFAAAIARWDADGQSLDQLIAELTAASADRMVAQPEGWIAFVHGITGPSALRLVCPHVSAAVASALARHLAHAVFALIAVHQDDSLVPDLSVPTPAELRERALNTDDDHVIKGIEAVLREHAITPRPRLLAAMACVSTG